MELWETGKNWEALAKDDPLFAVLTHKDKRGGRWNEQEFFATGEAEVAASFARLAALGIPARFPRALDFGCGVGRLTQAIARRAERVWGLDIAPTMIAHANRMNPHPGRCTYLVNTGGDLSRFPDRHFDLIYSKITLQHMYPRYAAGYLTEFLRVLAPGGVLIVQIPAELERRVSQVVRLRRTLKRLVPEPVLALYRRMTPSWRPLIEMYGIPKDEVVALVEGAGGRVRAADPSSDAEKWVGYEYYVEKT